LPLECMSLRTAGRRCLAGTVMIETLLALPLIMLTLGLLFYAGRGMTRLQGAQVMSRYETWRQADRVPDAAGPHTDPSTGNILMNDTFLAGRAATIDHTVEDRLPTDTVTTLRAAVADRSLEAERLLLALLADLPHGRTTVHEVHHITPSRLGRLFDGPIRQGHTRADHDWRFVNGWDHTTSPWTPSSPHAGNLRALRDVFFADYDQGLQGLAETGNPLAEALRQLTLQHEGYRGPTVEPD